MNILKQIEEKKIELYHYHNCLNTHYLIIHPETERNIFINEELPKNLDLGEHLNMKVILSKEVAVGSIIIGV
jgi:hypothetical protein